MGRRALTAAAVVLVVTLSGCLGATDPGLQPDGRSSGASSGPSPQPSGATGWHRVALDGVATRVPAGWVVQDTGACEFSWLGLPKSY